jgi:hypothetical protein
VSSSSNNQQEHQQGARTVHIPEIAGSLRTLFILRTVVVAMLVFAGVACLYFGGQMLASSLQASQSQTVLFEIVGSMKLTAGGFGAVVMAASLFPFFFAFLARPTIALIPTAGGGFEISDELNRNSILRFIRGRKRSVATNQRNDGSNTTDRRLTVALGLNSAA